MQTPKELIVWKVCDEMALSELTVTINGVGDRLVAKGYKRGSNRDTAAYVRSWRDGHRVLSDSSLKDVIKGLENKVEYMCGLVHGLRIQNEKLKDEVLKLRCALSVKMDSQQKPQA